MFRELLFVPSGAAINRSYCPGVVDCRELYDADVLTDRIFGGVEQRFGGGRGGGEGRKREKSNQTQALEALSRGAGIGGGAP